MSDIPIVSLDLKSTRMLQIFAYYVHTSQRLAGDMRSTAVVMLYVYSDVCTMYRSINKRFVLCFGF